MQVDILSHHSQFVHMKINGVADSVSWFLTAVYGSPRYQAREELWRGLNCIASSTRGPSLVMGDFNAFSCSDEKWGGASPNVSSMRKFNDCLFDCGLSDVGFKGPPFTWEWRGVKERLDRGVSNMDWRLLFPEASILHLPTLKSDHKPLLFSLCKVAQTHFVQRPFRFMASWLADSSFRPIVEEAWHGDSNWLNSVGKFQDKVTEWNVHCFGNIFHKKAHHGSYGRN